MLSTEPFPSPEARITATRTGRFGVHDRASTKFAIDFEGGRLAGIDEQGAGEIEFAVTAPRGRIERNHVMPIERPGRWRAIFEYAPADREPVELSGFLRRGAERLSEIWRFSFAPHD